MSRTTERTRNYKDYEKRVEIIPVKSIMPCSKCDGEMEFTGTSILTNPPYNVHKCDKCGCEEEFSGVTYPRIDYIPKN